MVSLYMLLGGEPVLEEIKADDVFSKRPLWKKLDLGGYCEEWEGTPKRLVVKDMTEKLRLLLVDAEEMSLSDQSIGYDFLFKPYSMAGTHATLTSIGLYVG